MRRLSPFYFSVPIFWGLIALPLLSLMFGLEREGIRRTLLDPFFWQSLLNSLLASALASGICLCLAISLGFFYFLKPQSWTARAYTQLSDLPMALPHTVAGIALLLAFGKTSWLWPQAWSFSFSFAAIVIAMVFTSFPVMAKTVIVALGRLNREPFHMACLLGDSAERAYLRVVIAQLRPALVSGFILTKARAISEFAAVVLFGGNVPGTTQVLASYVFAKIDTGEIEMAITAGVAALLLSLTLMFALRVLARESHA